ncbi:MAG: acetylornithine carbamoyltransferase [Bacteroidetes bacterium]|nr:acetylornithine carbamoyltransferase [Bacteroidota bacterium]
MKYFTTAYDTPDVLQLIQDAISLKENPNKFSEIGKNLTLGLVFMNPSLRTRLSTQKASQLLGMNSLLVNTSTDGWTLEFGDSPMNGTTVEHIKEAAGVMGEYCDIIGVRSFPGLTDREKDEREEILLQWMKHSGKPILSLESATRHPLQSLSDMMTIIENSKKKKPKVVLTWAPHVKAVPHAVANSFSEWMKFMDAEFVIACPDEVRLNEEYTTHATITNKQDEALEGADFVYVKSWAEWNNYGKYFSSNENWLLNQKKLSLTNDAKIMHCLPVRRDVEIQSEILESKNSLVMQQAGNRVYAAQTVLKKMIESNYPNHSGKIKEKQFQNIKS